MNKIINFSKFVEETVETRYVALRYFSLEYFIKARQKLKKYDFVLNQIKLNFIDYIRLQECLPFYQNENIIITANNLLGISGLKDFDLITKERLKFLAK
ncbi:MAG: hypothetical protein ACFFG0_09910 [Candidatus Thorarchaeota archaeon]